MWSSVSPSSGRWPDSASVLEVCRIARVGRGGDQLGDVGRRVVESDGRDNARVNAGFLDLYQLHAGHTRQGFLHDRRAKLAGRIVNVEHDSLLGGESGDRYQRDGERGGHEVETAHD